MSDPTTQTIVIVGAGMAGARAAITLRSQGHTGRLVLIGAEPVAPYERPPLSKHYLRGEKSPAEIAITPKDTDWQGIGVDLRVDARVTRVDLHARAVDLADGERIGFERLLLATGSEPRRLPVPGADLDGVLLLRTIADADRIRAAITGGRPIVVVGGGWIGGEVAGCCRQLGAEVTLLTGSLGLLERQLGPEVAAIYSDLHRRHGTDLRAGEAAAIEGADGRVSGVRLADRSLLPAAAVVVGIGAAPRLDLAQAAGLEVGRGVRVDPLFRTSAPGVWAVGDIAEAWHPLLERHVRLDHWAAAWFGGPAAARSMLDAGAPYERVPYLYSDQLDLSMEMWGVPHDWDRVVIRAGDEPGSWTAFWLQGGRVVGTMLGNLPDARKPLEALVKARAVVDPEGLVDPSVPLEELAGSAA
jgi:3-phenylpropionate/trans-cinnamate dioxygenase ferredoxin reductase subunit